MSAQPATGGAAGRISRLFGLEGDRRMRHTNPVSVWSRFSVLALLALAIWSRDWIGAGGALSPSRSRSCG